MKFSSSVNQSEDWNRTSHVIKEEDEASVPADQGGSGKSSRRPSSAGSLSSGNGEKVTVQRRVSSAGKTDNAQFSYQYEARDSVFIWRHGSHIGALKQSNGSHIGVLNQSSGN